MKNRKKFTEMTSSLSGAPEADYASPQDDIERFGDKMSALTHREPATRYLAQKQAHAENRQAIGKYMSALHPGDVVDTLHLSHSLHIPERSVISYISRKKDEYGVESFSPMPCGGKSVWKKR